MKPVAFIVVAWKPSEEEIGAILRRNPIFLTIIGTALPPHMLTTSFEQATHPS